MISTEREREGEREGACHTSQSVHLSLWQLAPAGATTEAAFAIKFIKIQIKQNANRAMPDIYGTYTDSMHAIHISRIFLHVFGAATNLLTNQSASMQYPIKRVVRRARGVAGGVTGLHVAYKLKLHIVSVQTFCVLLKENVLGNVFAKNSAKLVRQ